MLLAEGKGDFSKAQKYLRKLFRADLYGDLNKYGEMGVRALSASTPKDTAETAHSWKYRVVTDHNGPRIEWYNSHAGSDGVTSVAVLIQYGHGTRTGGYVVGRDFINPAMRPIFDQIAHDVWKKVKT